MALLACAPQDPRSRIDDALAVLQSGDAGARKAEACLDLRAALAEYPHDAPGRSVVVERAARLAVAALRDPQCRLEAGQVLVAIGPPSYEALFAAVVETEGDTQAAAVACLMRMSLTAVPVLIPSLLGDDPAAQDRAVQILARMGSPISGILRSNYAEVLKPFADSTGGADLSMRGKAGVLAFARLFGTIGDRASVLALIEGAEKLHGRHPDVAAAHLRITDGLGREVVDGLGASDRLNYERLRLLVLSP